ncbi:hypothetical protein BM221_004454 [Beauveria bassiana]|uniref:Uncharacterized protein n=1 Tax=Beauveria bassiana TaxID=176275 RepID=A0A2N6NRA4_BEABA|nr:hypothetical protein BM221_004454 [Beauveria bassiana]
MKLSNTFITLSIGLVAAGPLAIRNPQNSGIPFGANGLLGRAGANGSPQAPQQPSTELQPLNCGAGKVLLDGDCVNQDQSPEPSIEGNKTPATSSEVVDPGFAQAVPVPEGPLNSKGYSKAGCDNIRTFLSAEDLAKTKCDEFNLDKEATESEPVDPDFAQAVPVPEGPLNSKGFSKAGCDNIRTFLSAEDLAKTKCDEFGLEKEATESEPVDPGFAQAVPVPEGPLNSKGYSKAGCDNIRTFLSAEDLAKTKCDEFGLEKEATESEPVDPEFAQAVPVPEGPLNSKGYSKAGCDNIRTFLSAEDLAKTKCDEFN